MVFKIPSNSNLSMKKLTGKKQSTTTKCLKFLSTLGNFSLGGGRHWPRLPRAAVGAPSLAGLKARLDGALGNLGWGEGALPVAGGGTR